MPLIQQLIVSPKLPTALADQASVDLPGHDLWLYQHVNNVHVVPIKLDISRFKEALSRVLQIYPHAAGRLRSNDGRWFIELTNTGVPVKIDYKFNATSDTLLNGDWVVQDDLSPFLDSEPISGHSGRLLCLKLTFLDNETSIGVTWHHALGDAIVIFRFMHALSQFYQGLSRVCPSPTFEKHHFSKPSQATLAEFWPRVPHLHATCLASGFGAAYAELLKSFQDLKWRIDNDEIAELRSALSSRGQNGGYLSRQDCLSTYVIAALNHHTSTPVQVVANVSSFRNVGAPFIAEDLAGNLFQFIYATVPTDMSGIATALRHALVQYRKPEYIRGVMSVTSDCFLKTADAGKTFDWFDRDDASALVNSNTVIDWCSAHFGCPDASRFYTIGMGKRVLRCFRSNPAKGDDGVWRVRQSVDISMGVPTKLKPRLLETLGRGVQYMLSAQRSVALDMRCCGLPPPAILPAIPILDDSEANKY